MKKWGNGDIPWYAYLIGAAAGVLILAYAIGLFLCFISGEVTWSPVSAIKASFTSPVFYVLILIGVVFAVLIGLYIKVDGRFRNGGDEREFGESTALGSGGMATKEDEEKLLVKSADFNAQPYIIFGKDAGNWVGLNPKIDVNHFTAVCGPQQSGKSFKFVKTNLVQLAKNEHSVIISDPKGELYRDMSLFFEEQGYIVKQLNLFDLYSSDSWNALSDVNESNIDLFASTFIENLSDDREEQVHKDMKTMLFKSLCLYVLYEEKDISDDKRTLGQVYHILSTKNDENELDRMFTALDDNSKAKQTYLNWALGGKLKTNSIATLSSKLQIFQKTALCEITGVPDIDLSLPSREKCAYFLIMDDQNRAYSCISSVFIKLLIEKSVSYAKTRVTGRTDRRIHFMLDEFPAIGRIPDFKIGLGTWRGYGIDMTIIFQNIPQLMNRYPDNVWNEILAACAIQVCLGCYEDGDITAEHYSKMGGVGTIITRSDRRHYDRLNPLDLQSLTQLDRTESYHQAQAVYPSEVKDLILNGQMLVTIGASRPFRFTKAGFNETPYYDIPQKATFENMPKWLRIMEAETDYINRRNGLYMLGKENELPEKVQEMIREKAAKLPNDPADANVMDTDVTDTDIPDTYIPAQTPYTKRPGGEERERTPDIPKHEPDKPRTSDDHHIHIETSGSSRKTSNRPSKKEEKIPLNYS